LTLEAEVRRAYLERLRSLEDLLAESIGGLDDSSAGLAQALRIAAGYPARVREWFEADWSDDPGTRLATARLYGDHLTETIVLVDEWLLRAGDVPSPPFLSRAVEQECSLLGLTGRLAVLTIEDPDNFATLVADFEEELYQELAQAEALELDGERPHLALIHLPRLEGHSSMWLPALVGHEVAHLYVEDHQVVEDFNWDQVFDFDSAKAIDPPGWFEGAPTPDVVAYALERAAMSWVEELLCDAYSIKRFGPAALQSVGVFLEMNGARSPSKSHPPAWTRVGLMSAWLDQFDGAPSELKRLRDHWAGYGPPDGYMAPEWAGFLMSTVAALSDLIVENVAHWPGDPYEYLARENFIVAVEERLKRGLPSVELDPGTGLQRLTDADISNAGWLAISEDEVVPIDRLVRQSIETLQFLQQWDEASEVVPGPEADTPPPPEAVNIPGGESGVLSRDAIRARLDAGVDLRIELVPLLPGSVDDSAVDLRLGNKFLVFHSSVVDSFDPLDLGRDPRVMQHRIEKAWGDTFVLHPNELVLASALEYVALPKDVAGQVHTRSSYGRLGLLAATALHVHPWYMGALTLELVNLSEVPLKLTPGERVAQLVLYRVNPPAPPPPDLKKYRCSTFPEFSKVRNDRDSAVLRQMQLQLRRRFGQPDSPD
jgi:deoxycytidine triphosphate deaminase